MRPSRSRLASLLILGAMISAVALWRWDLAIEAARLTLRQIGRGGAARFHVLSEAVLFSGILAVTAWLIPSRVRIAHDAAAVLAAAGVGLAAEAWGTRHGLWRYYTGEKPPLWIVPAWCLGALLIERAAFLAESRWGRLLEPPVAGAAYGLLAAACAATILTFCRSWLCEPATWAILALVAGSLFMGVSGRRDFWLLASGLAMVFFADLWGTTNRCWAYAWQGPGPGGVLRGVAFGMAFDASLVLGSLRLSRLAEGRLRSEG